MTGFAISFLRLLRRVPFSPSQSDQVRISVQRF